MNPQTSALTTLQTIELRGLLKNSNCCPYMHLAILYTHNHGDRALVTFVLLVFEKYIIVNLGAVDVVYNLLTG